MSAQTVQLALNILNTILLAALVGIGIHLVRERNTNRFSSQDSLWERFQDWKEEVDWPQVGYTLFMIVLLALFARLIWSVTFYGQSIQLIHETVVFAAGVGKFLLYTFMAILGFIVLIAGLGVVYLVAGMFRPVRPIEDIIAQLRMQGRRTPHF